MSADWQVEIQLLDGRVVRRSAWGRDPREAVEAVLAAAALRAGRVGGICAIPSEALAA